MSWHVLIHHSTYGDDRRLDYFTVIFIEFKRVFWLRPDLPRRLRVEATEEAAMADSSLAPDNKCLIILDWNGTLFDKARPVS